MQSAPLSGLLPGRLPTSGRPAPVSSHEGAAAAPVDRVERTAATEPERRRVADSLAGILTPPTDARAEYARLAGEVHSFLARLPAMADPAAAGSARALRSLLDECAILAARNPGGVPFQLYSTAARVRRAAESDGPTAAAAREHLDAAVANFGVVEEGVLYRGAQPSRNGLAWLAAQGVRTVVTLRRAGKEDGYGYVDFDSSQEAGECRRLGMRSVSIPVKDLDVPGPEQVARFLGVVRDPASGPVFVHCAGGVGRTGVMAGAYQLSRGRATDAVLADMRRYGLDDSVGWARRQMEFVRSLAPGGLTLTFLHTGDLHGQFLPEDGLGGLAHLAAAIGDARRGREERTLLLDAGDSLAGSGLSATVGGGPVVDAMNAMGYDFATLGNHDFSWRKPVLEETLSAARFEIVDSNVRDLERGGPFLHEGARGSVLGRRVIDGVRVGVIGLTTPETRETEHPRNLVGLDIDDPQAAARAGVEALRAWGADLILVLSHLGLQADRALAAAVPGIQVIFGGHTHDRLEHPERVGETDIVQAGSHASDLGRLDVVLDPETKRVRSVDYQLIPVRADRWAPDAAVQRIVDRAVEEAARVRARPVGTAAAPLGRSGSEDSPLGNLVADALREAAGAEVALVNSGFLREDLPAGPLTAGHLLDSLPFEANVVRLPLRGDVLWTLLERSAAAADPTRDKSNMLQVSGLTLEHAGGCLLSVRAGDRPLAPDRIYAVATTDFLASGGVGYDELAQVGRPVDAGVSARDAVERFLGRHAPVIAESGVRIRESGAA